MITKQVMKSSVKIIIGGDLAPTASNYYEFFTGNIQELIDPELYKILNEADFRIFNLETPLLDYGVKISKNGPNLIAPLQTIHGIKALGADLVTLANNHIMDYGYEGLKSTIKVLDEYYISHVGAGENLYEAQLPFIVDIKGIRLGVYACAEHEFSIAENNLPGANPFDPLNTFDHICELKNKCDYLIVLHHGGKEHYPYPSPNLQKICRKLVEKGANLVVCQHSHCIGCQEHYKKGIIVYGQGNFLFDRVNLECWKTSLLIEINLSKNDANIRYIPIIKKNKGISIAEQNKKTEILSLFQKRSEEIKIEGFINNQYLDFAKKNLNFYLGCLFPFSFTFLIKVLNRLYNKRLFIKLLGNKNKIALLNYIICESHHELLIAGLKANIQQKENL